MAPSRPISVFDANTCNATVQSGCGIVRHLTGDTFSGPNGFEIDSANDTLYTANYDDTVSALGPGRLQCQRLGRAAPPRRPAPSRLPGLYSAKRLVRGRGRPALHTVYVTYQGDDSVAAVDTNVCNGANLAACATLHPPLARTGAGPQGVVLDPQTQTLYVANEIDNDVSVISASSCNAAVTQRVQPGPDSRAGGLAGQLHSRWVGRRPRRGDRL